MKNGNYLLIVCPDGYPGKHYRGRYAYEHVVNFWRKEGRMPKDGYVVHHINGDRHDNRFENLEEICRSDHSRHHAIEKPIKHGTDTGYRRGCKCDLCRAAHSASVQKYKKRKPL